MDLAARDALIEKYRSGVSAVEDALRGADDAALDRRPAPGEWTAREVAHHLADSETMSSIRLRRLIAEDEPLIPAYDEQEFARRLHYDRPIAASVTLFAAVRTANLSLLDALREDEWRRVGTHSEDGPYSVERWLEIYADHGHDHADQIRRARDGR